MIAHLQSEMSVVRRQESDFAVDSLQGCEKMPVHTISAGMETRFFSSFER